MATTRLKEEQKEETKSISLGDNEKVASSRNNFEQNFELSPMAERRWDRDLEPVIDSHIGCRVQAIENALKRHFKGKIGEDFDFALLTAKDFLNRRGHHWKAVPFDDVPPVLAAEFNLLNYQGALAWAGVDQVQSTGEMYMVFGRPAWMTQKVVEAHAEDSLRQIRDAQVKAKAEDQVETETSSKKLTREDILALAKMETSQSGEFKIEGA